MTTSDTELLFAQVVATPSPVGAVVTETGSLAGENGWRFSTKYFGEENGLGYWGMRWYSTEINRWLSRDPMEEEGFVTMFVLMSPSFSLEGSEETGCLYAFVQEDPVGRIDILGLAGISSGFPPQPTTCGQDCSTPKDSPGKWECKQVQVTGQHQEMSAKEHGKLWKGHLVCFDPCGQSQAWQWTGTGNGGWLEVGGYSIYVSSNPPGSDHDWPPTKYDGRTGHCYWINSTVWRRNGDDVLNLIFLRGWCQRCMECPVPPKGPVSPIIL